MNRHLHDPRSEPRSPRNQAARTNFLLLLVVTLLGMAAAISWFVLRPSPTPDRVAEPAFPQLSPASLAALAQLKEPVTVKFYLALDGESADTALTGFGQRVGSLLDTYAQAAKGKITLIRVDAQSSNVMTAASKEGIKPFNLDRGEGSVLGLAMQCGERKEVMPQLAPEWEPALESDLTRALLRLSAPPPAVNAGTIPPSSASLQELRTLLPDLDSASLDQGRLSLQAKAREVFAEVSRGMEPRLEAVRQKVADAPDEASRLSALKELQALQAEQTRKVREIAAQLEAQMTALEHLKKQ